MGNAAFLTQKNDILCDIFGFVYRGSAFPAISVAKEEKCLWDGNKRLAICGDFCVSPDVEGAIVSGMAAASKLSEIEPQNQCHVSRQQSLLHCLLPLLLSRSYTGHTPHNKHPAREAN